MGMQIRELTENIQGDANHVHVINILARVSSVRIGSVDPVCDIEARQEPVVCGVLEDVAEGHGG